MAHVSKPHSSQALVIIPTYNERDTIAEAVKRLLAAAGDSVEVLVVDDGSPDGTGALVRELQLGSPSLHLLERRRKLGLGTAYVEGFRKGIEQGYWALVEMDADLSHDPAAVPGLLVALAEADLAIGSRYVPGGEVQDWSLDRKWLSRAGNIYARAWLGFPIKDSTSGLRAYRTEFLARQNLGSVVSRGYGFQIEMARRIYRAGGRIVEVPICFTDRTLGRSKMSKRITFEAIGSVTIWGLRDRLGGRTPRFDADMPGKQSPGHHPKR
ncbi:MAG: dolichol-phosphate mannosyltransferase [Actinomycetota bacterium]|nr:dolichol-phosphate mannosyltransferase [Actinomycetota bacterium]